MLSITSAFATFDSNAAYSMLVELMATVGVTEQDFAWIDLYQDKARADIRVGAFSFLSLKYEDGEFIFHIEDFLNSSSQTYAFSGRFEDLESAFAKAMATLG